MKPKQVLAFMISCFTVMGLIGLIIPRDGIDTFVHIKFLHPATLLDSDTTTKIKLDDYLNNVFMEYQHGRISTIEDSLQVYIDFNRTNPIGIHYPKNDMTYFDSFFKSVDSAKAKKEVVRIAHYGDSQIESDRISGFLRNKLQEQFGGMGFGMIPGIQIIPSMGVYQNYSGAITRYAMYGEDVARASHRRYGPLAQMVMVYEQASVSVSPSRQAYGKGSDFQKVRLLFGHNVGPFSAVLTADGSTYAEQSVTDSVRGHRVFTWTLKKPASRATVSMTGTAEVYGIAFDGEYGITVDNIPQRGGSGTIFTVIDKHHLQNCYETMAVKMIIMQYGGNVMPAISGPKSIEWYTTSIEKDIKFLKEANPGAVMMFIGPSDMSKNIDGNIRSWPYLKEMNEALKETALKNGIAYWDMFNAMGGENSMIQWVKSYPPLASPDYIHFTHLGTETIAEMLFNSLMNDYKAYTLRQRIHYIQQDTIYKKPL